MSASDSESDKAAPVFLKLPRPINPPAFPTGSVTVRFMKSAIAANVPLIAVIGGLGYLGSHVVARLLTKGYFVRALVPQKANTDFLKCLPGANTRLQIIEIRDPSAEDALSTMLIAFRGASTVIHAATFSTHAGKIPKHVTSRRIVDALKIALDAASTPGNIITNFIYVSSEMTVFDPTQHSRRKVAYITENDWYDCSRSSREMAQPFAYAHTVAEMRLWARVGRSGLPFNMCSVIPSFMLGPVLSKRHISSTPSIAFLASILKGDLEEIPDLPICPVDVRDVTRAITALAERPEVSGRILLSAESLSSSEFIFRAASDFPQYRWPQLSRRGLLRQPSVRGDPDAVKTFKSWEFASKDRYGRKYSFSKTRACDELGLRFRTFSCTIGDTLKSLHRFDALFFANIGDYVSEDPSSNTSL